MWLNGELVYEHDGRRRHNLPNDRVKISVAAGENQLLVWADQGRGRYDFSLNICEIEADPRYAGNRLWGVQFGVPGSRRAMDGAFTEQEFEVDSEEMPEGAVVLEGVEFVRSLDLLAGSPEGALRHLGAEPQPLDLLGGTRRPHPGRSR